jgi:CDGSH-type Zn-finger protein
MTKPKIAGKQPIAVDLEKGQKKYFCACGESKGQPFCDGSHKTTSFKPIAFEVQKTGKAYLCHCKQSNNLPYCDGTHNSL